MKINVEADLSKYTKYLTFKNAVKVIWYSFGVVTCIILAVLPLVIWAFDLVLVAPVVSQVYANSNSSVDNTIIYTLANCCQVFTALSLILSVLLLLVFVVLITGSLTDTIKKIIKE